MSYTEQDHADLQLALDHMHLASELVNGVMERRRMDLTMQMVSFLSEAKHDADLGVAVVAEGDPAEAPPYLEAAERAIGMAGRYMNWSEKGKPE